MLGYGVMASNRIKSGLQVTESDGPSASDHATVLYPDPVHAAPRGGLIRPQNHQLAQSSELMISQRDSMKDTASKSSIGSAVGIDDFLEDSMKDTDSKPSAGSIIRMDDF